MANKADNQIKWVLNKMPKSDDQQVANMSLEEMSKANNFHKSFPQYSVTPLTGLPHLAEYLGLKKLYVKDESYRFGLNAFKVSAVLMQSHDTWHSSSARMSAKFLMMY